MIFALISIFIFGTIIGSFLNVVILRLNTGRGLHGRSACFTCRKELRAIELIPLFSFFMQGGKCTNCKSRISWQYPAIETVTGFVFTLLFIIQFSVNSLSSVGILPFLFECFIFSLIIIISVYDIRHKIIPNKMVWIFITTSFIFGVFSFGNFFFVLFSGIAMSLPFLLLHYLSGGRLMGLGDGKLALGCGFLLGIWLSATAFIFSFWIGAIISILLLIFVNKKFTIKSEIPFGPFLAISTFIAFLLSLDIFSFLNFFIR